MLNFILKEILSVFASCGLAEKADFFFIFTLILTMIGIYEFILRICAVKKETNLNIPGKLYLIGCLVKKPRNFLIYSRL